MKSLSQLLGKIIIPMLTPFKDDGTIHYEEAERLADFLVRKNYCDSLLIAGTTGEFNVLEHTERTELFKVVFNAVNGRIPLVAGTGAGSAREAVTLTRIAEQIGYQCAMVVGPYYCKPTQTGVHDYFAAIAASVDIPILLYNIPIFTGTNIDPETVRRLSCIKNVRGIKDESGINPVQMTDYRLVVPDDFSIYNGDDIMVLCGLAQGAAGIISGFSHLAGDQMRAMIELFLAGELEKARKYHMAFHPLLRALCANSRINPIPILRAAVELAGHPVGRARLPLDVATPEETAVIREHLLRLNILRQ